MTDIAVKTATGFDGRAIAQLALPKDADATWVEPRIAALESQGLTVLPGMIEGKNRYILRIYGTDSESGLQQDISAALHGDTLAFKGLFDPEPVEFSNVIAKWMYEHARWAYDRAGAITGGAFFAGASGLMYSALNPDTGKKKNDPEVPAAKPAVNRVKALSSLFLMTSSALVGLFVRQPKDPRHIHAVLQGMQTESANLSAPQVQEEIDHKDDFLTRAKENLRRYPWELAALINVPANILLTTSNLTPKGREAKGWREQSVIGLTNLVNMLVRIATPQNGGQSVLSRLPATRPLAEKLSADTEASNSALRQNPINITANVALATKVAGMGVAISGGRNDKGFLAMNAFELAGIAVSKATSKAVGIGFDETVTTAADFVESWKNPELTQEQKIAWAAKKLAKQPEIFHTEGDLAEGIARRLEYRQSRGKTGADVTRDTAETEEMRYTSIEQRTWANEHSPFAHRLSAKESSTNTPAAIVERGARSEAKDHLAQSNTGTSRA